MQEEDPKPTENGEVAEGDPSGSGGSGGEDLGPPAEEGDPSGSGGSGGADEGDPSGSGGSGGDVKS